LSPEPSINSVISVAVCSKQDCTALMAFRFQVRHVTLLTCM
jgi:hypothetical protein